MESMSRWAHSRGSRSDEAGQGSTAPNCFGEINILDCLEDEDLSWVLRPERGVLIPGSLREIDLEDRLTPVIGDVETGLVKETHRVFALHQEGVDALGLLIEPAGDLVDQKCQPMVPHDNCNKTVHLTRVTHADCFHGDFLEDAG